MTSEQMDQPQTVIRAITKVAQGMATQDGAGVKLTRILGSPDMPMHDPFLMLDEFRSDQANDYIAGFPDHPHRGFETVTYMQAGRMRHKDNKGHEGVIETGGVQWMTAGRGIVHSEMPEQESGLMSGFQLWINLPAAEKMKAPGYQEFAANEIPTDERDGATIKVIAGRTAGGIAGPIQDISTEPLYFDVTVQAGVRFQEAVAASHQAFIYVYQGDLVAAGTHLSKGDIGLFADGDHIDIQAGPDGAGALLLAGKAIGEPVAWGGPFVMNSKAEVLQAFQDYQTGKF
jgi:redox-sensitive bicupin YhaK (pirin superfamily)